MFVNLENEISIKKSEIIGIFNLDTASVSPVTKDFLKKAGADMKIVYASKRVPESFILSDNGFTESVCMSSFAVDTVLGRVKK